MDRWAAKESYRTDNSLSKRAGANQKQINKKSLSVCALHTLQIYIIRNCVKFLFGEQFNWRVWCMLLLLLVVVVAAVAAAFIYTNKGIRKLKKAVTMGIVSVFPRYETDKISLTFIAYTFRYISFLVCNEIVLRQQNYFNEWGLDDLRKWNYLRSKTTTESNSSKSLVK